MAAGQVAAVALGADADARLAGDRGAHQHLVDADDLQLLHPLASSSSVPASQTTSSVPGLEVDRGHAPRMRSRSGSTTSPPSMIGVIKQAVLGAAVFLEHHHVLGHVHQAAGQVPGVRGLQRRIREALAGAVGGDEVLDDVQPLAEVGGDRRLDDGAVRLGHQAAHAGELADLRRGTTGTGVGHHVDGVERVLLASLPSRRRPCPCRACASSTWRPGRWCATRCRRPCCSARRW
jgi:hypothetical protein